MICVDPLLAASMELHRRLVHTHTHTKRERECVCVLHLPWPLTEGNMQAILTRYISTRTCRIPLPKRTWGLAEACRGLIAAVIVMLPSWRAALKPL
jgi:hypothetical protein